MRLVDLLNNMEQAGTLHPLYKAGAVTLTVYSHREVYNYYHALLASPHYADKKGLAARATAQACRIARTTVYLAIRRMEQQV